MVQAQQKKWLTVDDFLAVHKGKFGRSTLYEALRAKTIPSVKIGRRILIPYDALEQILSKTSNENK